MLSIKLLPTFSYLNSCCRAFRQVFPKIIVIRTTNHANKKLEGGGEGGWGSSGPPRPSDFPLQNFPISVSRFSKFHFRAKITSFYRFRRGFSFFFALYNYIDWQIFVAFYTLFRVVNTDIMLPCCIFTVYKTFPFNFTICGVILGSYRLDLQTDEFRFKTQIPLHLPVFR